MRESARGREREREEGHISSLKRTDASGSSDHFHPPRRKSPRVGVLDIKLLNMARIVRFDAFPADLPEILNSVPKCYRAGYSRRLQARLRFRMEGGKGWVSP